MDLDLTQVFQSTICEDEFWFVHPDFLLDVGSYRLEVYTGTGVCVHLEMGL